MCAWRSSAGLSCTWVLALGGGGWQHGWQPGLGRVLGGDCRLCIQVRAGHGRAFLRMSATHPNASTRTPTGGRTLVLRGGTAWNLPPSLFQDERQLAAGASHTRARARASSMSNPHLLFSPFLIVVRLLPRRNTATTTLQPLVRPSATVMRMESSTAAIRRTWLPTETNLLEPRMLTRRRSVLCVWEGVR